MTRKQNQRGKKSSPLTTKLTLSPEKNRTETQFHRRMEMLFIISRERIVQVANLAFHFGVSTRTIKADIKALLPFGGFTTTQGNGGGIHANNNWHLGKYFTKDKIDMLYSFMALGTPEMQKEMQEFINEHTNPSKS